jgi:hypothetical protein
MVAAPKTDASVADRNNALFKKKTFLCPPRPTRAMQLLNLNLDGNGKSAPGAERLLRDFENGSGLLALVLALFDKL